MHNIADSAKQKLLSFNLSELKNSGFLPLNDEFLPAVHYPPITMYPRSNEDLFLKDYKNPVNNRFDIYVHIPFCIKYCSFCHYPVMIGENKQEKDKYLCALEKEIELYMGRLNIDKIKSRSVLIGGGTPTYLEPSQLKRFLDFLNSKVDLSSCTQFSYDVDPITISGDEGTERLKIMKNSGVTRLTIGIQSLDDNLLKLMNRHHNAAEAIESVEKTKKMGFKLCIEFIYGYPTQTLDSWIQTIRQAINLGVDEIQIYRLKIIPYGDHTGFIANKFKTTQESFPNLDEIMLMKMSAIIMLAENKYTENLIRVFTRDRQEYSHYAHNQCCSLLDQLGFGLTAFSSLRDRFGLNTQDFNEYYNAISQNRLPLNRSLVRNYDDQIRWALILPLKNRQVYKKYYQKVTGASLNDIFRKKIEKLKNLGLLFEDEFTLKLTERGRFFADETCHQFYHPAFMPFPREAYAKNSLSPYEDCETFT